MLGSVLNTMWIVVGLATTGIVAAIVRWRRGGRDTELGFVSSQWVAEQRLSEHSTRR
jgi:hypothetical protein